MSLSITFLTLISPNIYFFNSFQNSFGWIIKSKKYFNLKSIDKTIYNIQKQY